MKKFVCAEGGSVKYFVSEGDLDSDLDLVMKLTNSNERMEARLAEALPPDPVELQEGVQVLLDNGIALDAPRGQVQFDEYHGERISIHSPPTRLRKTTPTPPGSTRRAAGSICLSRSPPRRPGNSDAKSGRIRTATDRRFHRWQH